MFNVGFGELAFIMVVALLVLGPRKLPELARGVGKFMRDFRRQSEEIRHTVEREFYRMDRELEDALPKLDPPEGTRSTPPLHQAPPLPEDASGAAAHDAGADAAPAPADQGPEPHTPLKPLPDAPLAGAEAPAPATAPVHPREEGHAAQAAGTDAGEGKVGT